jgi:hypothetical protein
MDSQLIDEKINHEDESGIQVKEVRISIQKNFQKKWLNIPGPKFVKATQITDVNPHQLMEDEDVSISNPFENSDDLAALIPSDKLSEQEKKYLEKFNPGILLEYFRPNIENSFQTQLQT